MKDIEFKLKNKSGIYCIFNMVNGKRYIGSSYDIYNRLHEYFHNLEHNKGHNIHLQSAWNKYGKDAFKFEVLEYCDREVRFERELYYLDLMLPEYNFASKVIPNDDRIISDEIRKKISDTLKRKYASGELKGQYYGKNQTSCYVYNIKTWKLEAECKSLKEAIHLLYEDWSKFYDVGASYILNAFIKETYIVTKEKFDYIVDLKNYFYKKHYKIRRSFGKYLVKIDKDGIMKYYKTIKDCSYDNNVADYILRLKLKNDLYLLPDGTKLILLKEYKEIKETAVSIEKSTELLSGKIGEGCDANTEVNTEITQGPVSPLSVGDE